MNKKNIALNFIQEFKNNLNLDNFNSFLNSTYLISKPYVINNLKEFDNEQINEIIEIIYDNIMLNTDNDYLALYIHLCVNNKLSADNYLSDAELEFLLSYIDSLDELPTYIKELLIFNKRNKYQDKITSLLNKQYIKKPIILNYNFPNLYSLLLNICINTNQYYNGFDKQRVFKALAEQELLFNFLGQHFKENAVDEFYNSIKCNDYVSLKNLIKKYKLNNYFIKIKNLFLNYKSITSADLFNSLIFEANILNLKNIDNKILKEALRLTSLSFNDLNDFDKAIKNLSQEDLDEYLLKIRELFKGLCIRYKIDSRNIYQRELNIARGLYYVLYLEKLLDLKAINNKSIFECLEKYYNDNPIKRNINYDSLYLAINTINASKEAVFYDKKAFSNSIKKINGFSSPFEITEKLLNNKNDITKNYIDYFDYIVKTKSNEEAKIEISFERALLRQKQILDILYDINSFSFDMIIDYTRKLVKDNFEEVKYINIRDFSKEIKKLPLKKKEESANNLKEEIKKLKNAYKRIEELEIENKMEFLEKKQNICREIYKLQNKELNKLMRNKIQKPIEVNLGKSKKVFDKHLTTSLKMDNIKNK